MNAIITGRNSVNILVQILTVVCVLNCFATASMKKCYKLPINYSPGPYFAPAPDSGSYPVTQGQPESESVGSAQPESVDQTTPSLDSVTSPTPESGPSPAPESGPPPAPESGPSPAPESGPSYKSGPTTEENNEYLAKVSLKRGDLPRCKGSGHLDTGHPLNTDKLNAIFDYVGLPSISEAVKILSKKGAYNVEQNRAQEVQGAYLAWSTAAKLKILSPEGKTQDENELNFGALKRAGFRDDAEEVKNILAKSSAKTFDIPDQLMAYLWGSNEHHCLHAILYGNVRIKTVVHITSLNDNDAADNDDYPDEEDGLRGGYDDKGQATQWGIWEMASTFLTELGLD